MSTEQHKVIVIGSGFGGATCAARLVAAGVPVTLLERGPWRDTNAVRAAGVKQRAPLPAGKFFYSHALRRFSTPLIPTGQLNLHCDGLFDLHYDRQLSVLCSNGVGGGSHVYSAMNVRPAENYWDGHHTAVNSENLNTHYQWIMQRMESRTVADTAVPVVNDIVNDQQRPEWMNVDDVNQPAMGFRFNSNSFANNSFFGSADNSKVTVDELLLLPLLDKGLYVRDRHEVLDLCKTADGFRLAVMDHQHKRIRTMQAEQVILAAGTLNTLKLLFASRTRGSLSGMPALGHGIGGNGDVPAYWPCQEKNRDFTTGTPCHGRFSVDTNAINLTRYGLNGIDQIPMPAKLRQRLKHDLILVGMGADKADGKAHWYKDRLRLRYPQHNNPVLKNIYSAFEKIGTLSGRKVWFIPSRPLTVHPFGGARLGQNHDTGVINQYGEVHDIPGLFIADASALPAAPDVPPSMTIAAWAGHVADQFIQPKN